MSNHAHDNRKRRLKRRRRHDARLAARDMASMARWTIGVMDAVMAMCRVWAEAALKVNEQRIAWRMFGIPAELGEDASGFNYSSALLADSRDP